MTKGGEMATKATWRKSRLVIEGYRAIELDTLADEKENVREWSVVGRNGELYGYVRGKTVLPFRGCIVWEAKTANKLKEIAGHSSPVPFKRGEELIFQVLPKDLCAVMSLLDLDHGLGAEEQAEIMNEIKGAFDEASARIDDRLSSRRRGCA